MITHETPHTPESNPNQAVPAPEDSSVKPQETSETLESEGIPLVSLPMEHLRRLNATQTRLHQPQKGVPVVL